MIPTTIGRLVWREYRVMRGLWISLWLATLLLFLSPLVLRELQSIINRDFHIGWAIVLCMPLTYLVGAVATAFNREHENGTYAMLRQSPATPAQIATAKLGFAVLSSLLLMVVMTASFLVVQQLNWMPPLTSSPHTVNSSLNSSVMIHWVLYLGLIVGTATLASVYIRQPLMAVGVAGVAPLCTLLLAKALSLDNAHARWTFQLEPLGQLCLGIFDCLLLSAAGQVALGWLKENPRLPFRFRVSKTASIAVPEAASEGVTSISFRRHLARAIWIDRWKYLAYFLFAILVGRIGAVNASQSIVPVFWLWFVAFSAILGGTLFGYEQSSNHKRFLVERGVSGLRVWNLRHLIGVSFLLVALASWMTAAEGGPVLFILLPLYAAAHLCSLFFKSRIHAFVSAFLISGLGAFVLHFLLYYMRMPFWLVSLLPFCGLMLVGMLRANRWLIDRNHWRDWILPGALLASLGPAWLVVANVFRANELPATSSVRLPLVPAKVPMTEAEKQVRQTIERISMPNVQFMELGANDLMNDRNSQEAQWCEEHADLLTPALFDAIHQLDAIDFNVHPLIALLVADARRLQIANELEASLRDYHSAMQLCVAYRRSGNLHAFADIRLDHMVIQNALLWAVRPGQTRERIERLLVSFEASWSKEPPWNLMAASEYRQQLEFLHNVTHSLDEFGVQSPFERFFIRAIMSQPGEQIRAKRWLDSEFSSASYRLDFFEQEHDTPYTTRTLSPSDAGLLVPLPAEGMGQVMAQGPVCRTRRVDREATRWALRVIGANASWFEAEVYGITTDVKYDLTPYRVPDGELRIELPLQRAVINMAGRVALTSGTYTFFLPPRQEE